ncbi:hypothetical protein NDU88_005174 [Pleurodeles waltl]|uniref:Uncharacterized protein n=1 Tax=Pleurodeles waltl TaxID=8319 RepID=A0AAV7VMF6_PLEWA|nr:hypothetical protein NDU88_005174 [Pleurodeles waltl]
MFSCRARGGKHHIVVHQYPTLLDGKQSIIALQCLGSGTGNCGGSSWSGSLAYTSTQAQSTGEGSGAQHGRTQGCFCSRYRGTVKRRRLKTALS